MDPHVFRVILPVRNIEQATRFYAKVLGIEGKRVSSGRHYFDCGGTILACFDPRADGDEFEAQPNVGHIYFSVDEEVLVHLSGIRELCIRSAQQVVDEGVTLLLEHALLIWLDLFLPDSFVGVFIE